MLTYCLSCSYNHQDVSLKASYLYFPLVNPFVIFLQHHFPQLLVLLLQSLQHALIFEL